MVDLLSGKENKLQKYIEKTTDLQTVFLEEFQKLEKEVTRPPK